MQEIRNEAVGGAGGKRPGAGRKKRTEEVDSILVTLPLADALAVRAMAKNLTYNLGRTVTINEILCSFIRHGLQRYGDGDEEIPP